MKVSKGGGYARRALLSLALHGDGRTRVVREVADITGLRQLHLEQILLALKGAGLVRSKRGGDGGYVLAREPGATFLSQIVSAMDVPTTAGGFVDPHTDGACATRGSASYRLSGPVPEQYLHSFTLEDIATMSRGEPKWPNA